MHLKPLQMSIVAFGCILALTFAVAGAARADESAGQIVSGQAGQSVEPVRKGDRVAVRAGDLSSMTVEEVNLETGTSLLIRIEDAETDL